MTHERSSIDSEILRSLRSDAELPSPEAARRRVALRLMSAGVAVASGATSVAGSAAAMQAASTTAAAATLGGASLSGAVLVKVFALGLALGAGTGLGAHVVWRAVASERVAAVRVAPVREATLPVSAQERASAIEAPARGSERAAPAPSETSGARLPEPNLVSRSISTERARVAINQSPEPSSVGSLELDRRARLAEQQALLDRARAALRSGDAARALVELAEHRRLFPVTVFDEERYSLEMRALVAAGDLARARERLTQFQQRFGASLQFTALRDSVQQRSAPTQRVTEPNAFHQSTGSSARQQR